ncbi:MAG: DMT family transporter [Lachnospiraceae bacterium]|nr:DMT family transporter [Lachnospiraceae bacterium]
MDQTTFRKLIVLSGTIGISFAAIFIRFSTAPSPVLVLYRMAITALILVLPTLLQHKDELKELSPRVFGYCVVSGLFLTLHFFSYFNSVRNTSVASAVLLTDAEVFFTGIAGFLLFGEKLSRRSIWGIFIAFAGCVIVALSDAGSGSNMLYGDLLALLASVAMAGYTMMGRVCRQYISTTLYTLIIYTVTAVCSLIVLLATGTPVLGYEPINWLTTFGMAVVCTLLGHNIFSWGLKYLKAATVSTIKLAEPVFSAILAVIFFREIPAAQAIFGSVIIIAGIWWYLKNTET